MNKTRLTKKLAVSVLKCISVSNPEPAVLTEICVGVVKAQQTALYKYRWVTRPTANRTGLNLIKSTQHALCSNVHPLAAPLLLLPLPLCLSVCFLSDSVSLPCILADRETQMQKYTLEHKTPPYHCTSPPALTKSSYSNFQFISFCILLLYFLVSFTLSSSLALCFLPFRSFISSCLVAASNQTHTYPHTNTACILCLLQIYHSSHQPD